MPSPDVRLSKYLSRILRHQPESAGLLLDREGWADLAAVLAAVRRQGLARELEDIHRVVANNNKQRFSLSPDGTAIRAVQGHSTPSVSMSLAPVRPPAQLYHGTADKNLPSILETGLHPGGRHHVHLSRDSTTAMEVGRRHGTPVVLEIAAGQMFEAGHPFFQAENGVWLTAFVPPWELKRT